MSQSGGPAQTEAGTGVLEAWFCHQFLTWLNFSGLPLLISKMKGSDLNQFHCIVQSPGQHRGPREPRRGAVSRWAFSPPTRASI